MTVYGIDLGGLDGLCLFWAVISVVALLPATIASQPSPFTETSSLSPVIGGQNVAALFRCDFGGCIGIVVRSRLPSIVLKLSVVLLLEPSIFVTIIIFVQSLVGPLAGLCVLLEVVKAHLIVVLPLEFPTACSLFLSVAMSEVSIVILLAISSVLVLPKSLILPTVLSWSPVIPWLYLPDWGCSFVEEIVLALINCMGS